MSSLFQSAFLGKNYAAFRPLYPPALFQRISQAVQTRHFPEGSVNAKNSSTSLAVDFGCGSGQATVALVDYFDRVIGIDPSPAQLTHAEKHDRVEYHVGTGCESANDDGPSFLSSLPDESVDCITAAQAAHWFDTSAFYVNANRILKPGGVVALWMYGLLDIPRNKELQEKCHDFYYNTLAGYWDDRRNLVDNLYRDIPLIGEHEGKCGDESFCYSGERIMPGSGFDLRENFTPQQLAGYFRSWSGYAAYCKQNQIEPFTPRDPVQMLEDWMAQNLDHRGKDDKITVTWPVVLLLSIKNRVSE